ncbi:MAG: type II toxin-antitoxin system HicB family antitoxin [Oscillospiraceae bacterium]|nr:type II toxin-antitoxin system HicB family antitoxin [Oscillospiraceae bacterium]
MTNNDFLKKLAGIPEGEPDEIDRALLAEIDAERDPNDKGKSLESIIAEREYNGRILLRIPKELHAELIESAKEQGVSLNQYCLYRLSHTAN